MNKLIKEFAIEWAKYLDWDFPNDLKQQCQDADRLWQVEEFVDEAIRAREIKNEN